MPTLRAMEPRERPPIAPAISIPDDFVVWVFSDAHGGRTSLVAALREAGLIDESERWIAPPRTALVGLGDYIDRGADSMGVLRLLVGLRDAAASREGMVVLCEGNHEQMARDGLALGTRDLDDWIMNGGRATLESIGLSRETRALHRTFRDLRIAIDSLARDFRPILSSLSPYATYRDICLVHAGWATWLDDLSEFDRSQEHIWVRTDFLIGPDLDAPAYAAFARAGLRRCVIGHTPVKQPAFFQDDRVLDIDTNACANPRAGFPELAALTLVRLPVEPAASLTESFFVSIPTADAPDRCTIYP